MNDSETARGAQKGEDTDIRIGDTAFKVLLLVSEGKTNKEISRDLMCSESNVEGHIGRLNKLLGTSNRTQAAIKGLNLAYHQRLAEAERECARLTDELALSRARENQLEQALNKNLEIAKEIYKTSARRKQAERLGRLYERMLSGTRAIFYELASLHPVTYRSMSASAKELGIDVEAVLSGRKTFYDLIYEADLDKIHELSPEETLDPRMRYTLMYRLLTPEPRWMMDVHRAIYVDGTFLCTQGLVVDIHAMVEAGLVEGKVNRIVVACDEMESASANPLVYGNP
jgi:DNA-binding CsgD family transcriptional regulator